MANYTKDPRTNLMSEDGLFLDWCNSDVRYYYNGSYLDLCGLPPEEYMKNWFCCCGENGGESDDVDTIKNAILIAQKSIVDEQGNTSVLLTATSSKPTSSDVTVTVVYEYINEETNTVNSATTQIRIPLGQKEGTISISKKAILITTATSSPKSDDVYHYITEGNINSVISNIFYGIYPSNGNDEGITVGLEKIINNTTGLIENTYHISVELPYTYYDGKITDEVIKAHEVDIVLAIDADVKDFLVTDPNGVSYGEFLSDVIKLVSVETVDTKGNNIVAFYNIYRLKSNQFVNVDNKPNGEDVPFDIKVKI